MRKGVELKSNFKSAAIAPSNIAFIKYWGRKNETLRLPSNGSISMNLDNLYTKTTVEYDPHLTHDILLFHGKENEEYRTKVSMHLDRIRNLAGIDYKARVTTENSFPTGTGLSSSASSFAALTLAGVTAAGLQLTEKELSILARQGSGSACRSIPNGFVEWIDGTTNDDSYAYSLHPADHWDLVDVVAVLDYDKKKIATSAGQQRADSSPFFEVRQKNIKDKLTLCKKLIKEKNFTEFGELIEAEALELHAIMLTSHPALIYLLPQSLDLIQQVIKWRSEGLPVYFSLNTGQNVHLICEGKNIDTLLFQLETSEALKDYIVNRPTQGAYLSST